MSFRSTISYILWPLTIWYGIGVRIRNGLFSLGLLKQQAPHITTIGVGNLSTGGTGKTPHVEYLLRLFGDTYRVAMLSRGYKRKSKGFVVDDGSHDAALLGDEAAMIAQKFPNVQVAVCEKRVEGVQRLIAEPPKPEEADEETQEAAAEVASEAVDSPKLDMIVLDDVYQHRYIKPSINILLTEYRHPYFKDHVLPFGNLREPQSGCYRANIVIVTKCPARLNPIERHNITHDLKLQNYQKVFFSYFVYKPLRTLDGYEADIDLKRVDYAMVLTGIAHPENLVEEVRRYCKVRHMGFADHHNYSARDMEQVRNVFNGLPGSRKIIITTEKDAPRLMHLAGELPIYVQPVEVAFHQNEDSNFDALIRSSVKENISFLSKLSIWS